MRTCIIPRLAAVMAFASCLLPSASIAETAAALSNIITVDTRGGTTVRGQMVDGTPASGPYLPLAGVTVTIGSANAVTGVDGTFSISADLVTPATFSATMEGFMSHTVVVEEPAEVDVVDLGLIPLRPATDKPIVEDVKPDVDGIYIAGFGLTPNLKATVNWNENTPGRVVFSQNGKILATVTGAGPEYTATINVDAVLSTSPGSLLNVIQVDAIAEEEGQVSEPFEMRMAVVPLPTALLSGRKYTVGDELKVRFSFPGTKPFGAFDIGPLGSLGGEMSAAAEFSYKVSSGAWKVETGGKFEELDGYSAFRLKLGLLQNISAEIKGNAKGTATRTEGIVFKEFGGGLSLGGKWPVGSYSPLGLLGPTSTALFTDSELGKAFRAVSVIIWVKPGLDGQFNFDANPLWDYKDFTFTGKLPIEAAYEPTLGKIKAKFYVGGEPSVKFGLPGEFFREIRFKAYAGLEANIWSFKTDLKYVFVDESYPAGAASAATNSLTAFGERYQVLAAAQNATATWQVMQRPWRDAGGEVFLPQETEATSTSRKGAAPQALGSSMKAFERMGQSNGDGESNVTGIGAAMIIPNDPAAPVQATFPLLSNVFPDSEPALAGKGDNLILLYVRDNGAANPIQFTEVAFSYFDGTTWTVPAPIAGDIRGQFSPQVVFDGAGNAMAVFERIKDGTFAGTVMADMAALMEIVWSRWDAVTEEWSVPQALTDNAYLDFNPKLSGPLTDGDLLMTWNESETNQIGGTGTAGAATNLRVMARRWDSGTQTWGSAAVLVPSLTGELSESLAARGNKGVYVWSVDMDGDTDNSADAELFYRLYNATTGTWSPTMRHTNDGVVDHHAKAVVDAAGNVYAVWNRNGDLMMDVNFAGTPTLVRSGAGTLGVADFALTISPAGNLALIWQEMTENGSDAHYRVYDPLSSTWGKDAFLSQDSDLERSFAPVWDAAGNLTLAYNNVVIAKQTVNVAVEGGGTVSVDGVPQPGRVDLLLAKRAIVKDLSIAENGLTATGTYNLPGDAITLTAKVRNTGNVAVENVEVSFYNGNPEDGGTLIEAVTLPGWLKAADEAETSINWTIPEPAIARTVFVKVDPDGTVTEEDEENNTLSLPLNGVDLQLDYVSGTALRDGSARVVARVTSLSAPESPVTMIRLKSEDGTVTLAETAVSQLSPGGSVEIPFDLPAGTQPEGDRAYRLIVDEEEAIGDVDSGNNGTFFSLNLWIDMDRDGIPNEWEVANGMSDDNAADANLDTDGDGFTAKQEYLAGTDPRNSASVLKVGEVARQSTPDGTSTLVSWASVVGRRYQVKRSFDLSNWTILEDDVEATPPLNTVLDSGVPPSGKVFYRLSVK